MSKGHRADAEFADAEFAAVIGGVDKGAAAIGKGNKGADWALQIGTYAYLKNFRPSPPLPICLSASPHTAQKCFKL